MSGRVLYASFATPHLSGGVDVHLRHIALLRAAGVEASLWLPAPEVPAWMGEVPVVSGPTLEIGAEDVVLYPEAPVVPGVDPAPGARKVVFNQNHFYTYATWDAPAAAYPGWDPAPSVWTVSRESVAVIAALHPDLAVHRVPAPVDPDLFGPAEVQRGVALLPKKRPHEGRLLERLLEDVPWRAERRPMYDRVVDVPRLLCHYAEGERLPHPALEAVRDALNARYAPELGEPLVSAGLCLYRDGADSVAWHGDTIGRGSTHDTIVAIVSVGAARTLALRPRGGGPTAHRFSLGHGDLVVMGGSCQRTWEHAIPKSTSATGPRISIQFRPRGVR